MNRRSIVVVLLLLATHATARAQADTSTVTRRGWSLDRTMRAFVENVDAARAYFPTRGEWTWVLTTHYPGRDSLGVHRFPAAQTDSALGPNGPVCDMFSVGHTVAIGTVAAAAFEAGETGKGDWRRVSGTRFVPPGRGARSPVFVQWRREDGRWVISSFGGEHDSWVRLVGRAAAEARDTLRGRRLRLPLPAGTRLASSTEWYRAGQPIRLTGPAILTYGTPRQVPDGSLVYYTTYDGVGVWVEPGELASRWGPVFLYLPVDTAGTFQTYANWGGNGCN